MADMTPDSLANLRKAFPKEAIGKLPKGGMTINFVGHAAVTDRLLTVDPSWTWMPVGVDDHGLPALDEEGNLWIHLTVLGVTRLGVGDGKTMKERIGDALRNAAMRFGVALDLWTKDELESTLTAPETKNEKPSKSTEARWDEADIVRRATPDTPPAPTRGGKTREQSARFYKLGGQLGIGTAELEKRWEQVATKQEADEVIAKQESLLDGKGGEG